MSQEQPKQSCQARRSQGLTQTRPTPQRVGETVEGAERAGHCFPWVNLPFGLTQVPLAGIVPHVKAIPWHWPNPFPLPCVSVSLFFCPSYSLLLLSPGRASTVWASGCWPLQSASGMGHMGGDKLWSPLSFPDQYIRRWAPGTPGSCSGSWHPGLERERQGC